MIRWTSPVLTLTVTEDGWTLDGSIYKKSGNAWQQVSSTVLDNTIAKE